MDPTIILDSLHETFGPRAMLEKLYLVPSGSTHGTWALIFKAESSTQMLQNVKILDQGNPQSLIIASENDYLSINIIYVKTI